MALLRKYIRDDAGSRVPLYRTGLWPWRLPHEQALSQSERAELGWTSPKGFEFWIELAGRAAAAIASPVILAYLATPVITSNVSGRVSWGALTFVIIASILTLAGIWWCLRWLANPGSRAQPAVRRICSRQRLLRVARTDWKVPCCSLPRVRVHLEPTPARA
ncbi:MAG: hypothetical protein R3B49_01970 [Phycisphaerales bacterium]